MENQELPLVETSEVSVAAMDNLVQAICEKRTVIESLESVVSEHNKELAKLQAKLTDIMKLLERDSYDSPAGRINIIQQYRYRMPDSLEDRAKLFDFMKARNEYDGLITVHSQTFNSYCKKLQEAAEKAGDGMYFVIPGVEAPSLFETIRVTRKK